ncbi:TrbC/VirB2 family protein [Luteimonas sp. MC1828]|uniref:TrbC/VirB2 family protein n=1 Tax=Luteimonas sp. MC1828 TaxID=2799787 RepID=UPI0018F11A78|nr:TrbC/VirB2 family protein [Luteimonas sp. MC1828]MBJ7573602.1 TrbC/VirB2 family protein [Luteimonas sp. MC1828]
MNARKQGRRHQRHFGMRRPVFVATIAVLGSAPYLALAQGFGGADTKVCGFFENVNGLLNMASIAVVTIAIIFAGYQIAFAHKRIADVAPILIGGLLIGAAAQIARMLLGPEAGECTAMLGAVLPVPYA